MMVRVASGRQKERWLCYPFGDCGNKSMDRGDVCNDLWWFGESRGSEKTGDKGGQARHEGLFLLQERRCYNITLPKSKRES